MRIAAGVMLIIMAIANLIGGATFAFGGAVLGGAADGLVDAAKESGELTDQQAADFDDARALAGDKAGLIMAYGFGDLIAAILEFVAAIFCFTNKNPMFVMVAGIVEIALCIAAIFTVGPGLFIWIILGVITGGIAIAAANQMKAGPSGPDPNMMAGNMPPMG